MGVGIEGESARRGQGRRNGCMGYDASVKELVKGEIKGEI